MAFDGIARALLTGTAGFMQGRQQHEEDEERRRKEKAQANLEAEARKREAEMDAVRTRLLESQITRNLTPDVPTPRNIDPRSEAGIAADVERARRIAEATARYRRPDQPSPAQNDLAAREEAEGLAILNTSFGTSPQAREIDRLMRAAFKAARAAGSNLSPGRLTLRLFQGIRRSRPELFRVGPRGSDDEFGGVLGPKRAAPRSAGPDPAPKVQGDAGDVVPPSPGPRPAGPVADKVQITQDEYDMLVELGRGGDERYTEEALLTRFEVVE